MKNDILKITATAGLILVLSGLTLTGCESDSVAPHDQTPELSQENAAYQGAIVALAITEVGPQILNLTPSKNVYTYDFTGFDYVSGQVTIDYRQGGVDGTPATPDQADYAQLTTVGEMGLNITYQGVPNSAMYLTANITGNIDQGNDLVTILPGSGGTLVSGVYVGEYAINGLVVGGTGYPSAGTVTLTAGTHTVTVTFDGTSTALVDVDGMVWFLNLDDGSLNPV